jgi:hypothetical protein
MQLQWGAGLRTAKVETKNWRFPRFKNVKTGNVTISLAPSPPCCGNRPRDLHIAFLLSSFNFKN